jgi:hypothetical protein
MAYEIFNHASITPQRVYALTRLVAANPRIKKERILTLLQPKALNSKQSTAEEILDAAVKIGLVKGDVWNTFSSNYELERLETYPLFRGIMQDLLLGIEEDGKDNFLLNLFIAWFAVNNGKYLKKPDLGVMATDFNRAFDSGADGRALNSTKLQGMDDWMIFLGFGWKMTNFFIIPDASGRIEPLIDGLLPAGKETLMGEFMKKLAKKCPELDTGILFEKSRQTVAGNNLANNQISLMLSIALRTLEKKEKINLIFTRDVKDTWILYQDLNSTIERVTHISKTRKTT